jgi:hypothetical protein
VTRSAKRTETKEGESSAKPVPTPHYEAIHAHKVGGSIYFFFALLSLHHTTHTHPVRMFGDRDGNIPFSPIKYTRLEAKEAQVVASQKTTGPVPSKISP